MERTRTTLLVTIEQDPVPGWGNKPEDHEKWLRQTLESMIGHYHPTVELHGEQEEPLAYGDMIAGMMEYVLERAPRIDLSQVKE